MVSLFSGTGLAGLNLPGRFLDGFSLGLAQRHGFSDEILQCDIVDAVILVDVDGANCGAI